MWYTPGALAVKITVIGSGLLGLTTAYFLAKTGHQVTIIDRQEGPALETSFANGGLLTPSLCDPWNAPGVFTKMLGWLGHEDSPVLLRPRALPSLATWGLNFLWQSGTSRFQANMRKNVRLARYNLRVMADLRSDIGLSAFSGGQGSLKICRDQETLDHVIALSKILEQESTPFEVVDKQRAFEIEPALGALGDKVVGGMLFPEDEFGDAHQFCIELAAAAEQLGVTFAYQTTVTGFKIMTDKITHVVTDQGLYESDAIVLAAGSYSTGLAKSVGVRLPVRPCKGYSLTVPVGSWADAPKTPVIDDMLHAVVTPLGDTLRVAGTAEFNGYDTAINAKRVDNLYQLLAGIYPEFSPFLDRDKAVPWTGLRPVTASGVPVIGRTAIRNLFVNTGHGHLGWTMAAGSGKALSDLINGANPSLNMQDYQL